MTVSRRVHIFTFLAFLSFGLASLSGVPVEPDERKIDPFLLHGVAREAAAPRTAVPSAPAREGLPLVPVFVKTEPGGTAFEGRIRNLGGDALRVSERLYVAHIPSDSLRYITRWGSVLYVEGGKPAKPMLDLSRPATSADIVQEGSSPMLPRGFTGAGINVGIVDTGLDESHPDFSGRVVHTYSFSPGSVNPLEDANGHGTHVAGIAAGDGTGSSGEYTGMAPDANLLIGKTNFLTTDIVIAVSDLMNASVGPPVTPIAVNLSLGLMTGPHDGTDENEDPQGSLFTQAINELGTNPPGGQGIIVVAAGNEQDGEEHFQQATLPAFGVVTAYLKNLLVPPDRAGIDVDIWADGEDRYTVTVTMGSSSVSAPSGTNGSASGITVSNRTDAPPNGATHIAVTLSPPAGTTTASIRFERTRNGGTGKIDAYLDNYFDSSTGLTHNAFQTSTIWGTVTEPANADNVIAVGSFDTKKFPSGAPDPIQDNSFFSSLGPTRDGRTKPDLAAPGYVIYSTRSFDAPDGNYWSIVSGNDNNYAILAGTSMAAPHVTGIAALVWESNPSLTGAQMRERLKKTADPPPGAPDNTWGHGKVNALRAVTEPVAAISAPRTALPGTIVQVSGIDSSGAFGSTDSLTYAWSLVSQPAGSSLGFSSSLRDDSFTPTVPGNYTVSLTVTQPGPTPGSASDNATIHVNNLPITSITGPPSSDNTDSVSFSGTASIDPDGDNLTFHWILLSKPPESSPNLLSPVGPDNTAATLFPDRAGTYEVGLRVDDGLDNSILATKTYTVSPVSSSGGGGGGGCTILVSVHREPVPAPRSAPALLLLPLAVLRIRRAASILLPSRKTLRGGRR